MIKHSLPKSAFTLLELIFVIVILGIVSSIGASLIANVYDNYITQRALHTASAKADIAAKQIAARLTYRLSPTVIGRKLSGHYKTIDKVDSGDDYRILEWIAYDNDSFSASTPPGWSGFCDINHPTTTRTTLVTPGSKLPNTAAIITNLGGATTDAAIVFNSLEYATGQNYHIVTMGYGTTLYDDSFAGLATPTISPVTIFTGNDIINVSDNNAKVIHDQYKLVWSAYALVPVQQTDDLNTTGVDESKLFNLDLHYNYQPWLGENYNTTTNISTLITDVTVFKFRGIGNTIRFKICIQEKISGTETVNACKEKVVIR